MLRASSARHHSYLPRLCHTTQSPEAQSHFREGILVRNDPLFDGLFRGEVVVLGLKLAVWD